MKDEKKMENSELEIENKELLKMPEAKTSELKIDLNLNGKEEEKIIENNLEEEESLRYDKNYQPLPKDCPNNILKEPNTNGNFYRKSSNISTTVSVSENGFDALTPKKSDINLNISEVNDSSSHIFFGRNRFYSTPICDYFDGIDNYFKKLNPEKNNYQKSNNYLKKELFFRGHLNSFDLINSTNENYKESKPYPKLSFDLNYINPIPLQTPIKTTCPQNNINKNSGKFDFPIYYFGYYSVDCK